MLVSSPPFHGGEPGAAPGSPTKTFWAVSSVGKTLVLQARVRGSDPLRSMKNATISNRGNGRD